MVTCGKTGKDTDRQGDENGQHAIPHVGQAEQFWQARAENVQTTRMWINASMILLSEVILDV